MSDDIDIPGPDLICAGCHYPLFEDEAVTTGGGLMHPDCADFAFGADSDERDPGIPKG